MINDEYLVSSCERTNQNFQIFSQDLASATNIIGRMIQTKGVSKELHSLFVHLQKLSLSYLEFRKEYLDVIKDSVSYDGVRSELESAIEENDKYISETNSEISRFN